MIVVAGGSGRLGSIVVDRLVGQRRPVRVITRDATTARRGLPAGVDIVVSDVRDREAMRAAVDGAAVVVSAVHGLTGTRGSSPTTVDRDGNRNIVDAAHDAGASMVLMSIVGAAPGSPLELLRMKAAAEEHLWASGVAGTVVRASAFLELHVDNLMKSARRGRPVVLGAGDHQQNFVSVQDVAAVVCWAIDEPRALGRTVEVIGYDNLSMTELAERVQQVCGWTGAPRHIPLPVLKFVSATVGLAAPPVRRVIEAVIASDHIDLTAQPVEPELGWPAPRTTVEDVLRARSTKRPDSRRGSVHGLTGRP